MNIRESRRFIPIMEDMNKSNREASRRLGKKCFQQMQNRCFELTRLSGTETKELARN